MDISHKKQKIIGPDEYFHTMNCVETKDLIYGYAGHQKVLNGIDIDVPEGCIYGFLGPNGAGKTTTLRLLLGLLKNQQGNIRLFGEPFARNRNSILKKTGSLIESPSLYGHLTARENLQVWQLYYQCPKDRIKEVLEIVGLADTTTKLAGRFSLGMKQRLAIAVAILHNPSLIILDEPTNGLDPNGIIDIRKLLIKLHREQGMTILVSSHLLTEIEKIATHVGIIHHGQILFQGTLEELSRQQNAGASISFETANPSKTVELFLSSGIATTLREGKVVIPAVENQIVAKLNRQLASAGVDVYRISQQPTDLESIFMDLVK
jgi:ABC-2 type transport system ATP-binding protein